MKFIPDSVSFNNIPTCELKSRFNPMNVKAREQPAWITLKRNPFAHNPFA